MSDLTARLDAISGKLTMKSTTIDRLKEDGATEAEILLHLEAELATLKRYVANVEHQIRFTRRNVTIETKAKAAV